MLSQALKIIMNAFYGVLGTSACRFFDPRLASSITLRGPVSLLQMLLPPTIHVPGQPLADRGGIGFAVGAFQPDFYGVLGTSACRFFDPRLASSITLRGHAIMQQTRELIEASALSRP
jgi:DNA polymerase elongation subunit (family B)